MKALVEPAPPYAALRAVPEPAPLAAGEEPKSSATTPVVVQAMVRVPEMDPMTLASLAWGLGSRQQVEDELDGMAVDIRSFWSYSPDLVLRKAAAYTARLTELYVLLNRAEATDRQYIRLRTQQVQEWLQELDRQFKVASRLIEVSRQDIEVQRGY